MWIAVQQPTSPVPNRNASIIAIEKRNAAIAPRNSPISFFGDRNVGVGAACCSPGIEEDHEGLEKYFLLPAKHLRRERRAHEKHQGQCCQVARVRPPCVTLPNPFEQ